MREGWAFARAELVFSASVVWWRGSYNNLHLAEGGLPPFGKLCSKLRFPTGYAALQNLGAKMKLWQVFFLNGSEAVLFATNRQEIWKTYYGVREIHEIVIH